MPKLRESKLLLLREGTDDLHHRVVDLRHLKKGQRFTYYEMEEDEHRYLIWNDRDNVVAGLQELLEVGLKYHDDG